MSLPLSKKYYQEVAPLVVEFLKGITWSQWWNYKVFFKSVKGFLRDCRLVRKRIGML